MGIAMARNEAGSNYFDQMSRPTAGIQPDSVAQPQATTLAIRDPQINVDFRTDWAEFLKRDMTAYGLRYTPARTLEVNTDRYLNAKRRIPRQAAREMHESRELCIPSKYTGDYSALTRLIREGGSLKPYLSRDIRKGRADNHDPLLNRWGIHHLHFRRRGTDDVLFAKITNTDVFVIQAFPHDKSGHTDIWVNTSLLQILHDNWPETAEGKANGIPGESLMASERLSIQRRNQNFLTTMLDGSVYLSPGGGVLESGQCFDDLTARDKIFSWLAYWQKVVEDNGANFRAALNIPSPEELSIKLTFDNDDWWRVPILYSPTKQAKLSLTIQD